MGINCFEKLLAWGQRRCCAAPALTPSNKSNRFGGGWGNIRNIKNIRCIYICGIWGTNWSENLVLWVNAGAAQHLY